MTAKMIELEDDGWDTEGRPVVHYRSVPESELAKSLYRFDKTDHTGRRYRTRYAGGGEVTLDEIMTP